MRYTTKFNLLVLLVSVLAGVAAWVLGVSLYGALVESLARPVLLALVFGLLVLILALGIFLSSVLSGTFEKDLVTGGGTGSAAAALAVILILVMALSALFQWLYSIRGFGVRSKPTAFVFLMDDSGSMSESDPHALRYSAIEDVLDEQGRDFPYMVYGFSDGVELRRPMAPASEGADYGEQVPSGRTAIREVLERVITDYEDGKWDGGKSPKVILLSDGYPTDFSHTDDIQEILARYSRAGISISTVGLDEVDTFLMTYIADSTGGVFVDIGDASKVGGALSSAANLYLQDDLLSTRFSGGQLGILFGFLRVLFLTLLGTAIGLTAAVAYGQLDCVKLIFVSSLVKSLLGALVMEVGTSVLGLPENILWLVLWVLIALTLCTKKVPFVPRQTAPHTPAPPPNRHGRRNRSLSGS